MFAASTLTHKLVLISAMVALDEKHEQRRQFVSEKPNRFSQLHEVVVVLFSSAALFNFMKNEVGKWAHDISLLLWLCELPSSTSTNGTTVLLVPALRRHAQ